MEIYHSVCCLAVFLLSFLFSFTYFAVLVVMQKAHQAFVCISWQNEHFMAAEGVGNAMENWEKGGETSQESWEMALAQICMSAHSCIELHLNAENGTQGYWWGWGKLRGVEKPGENRENAAMAGQGLVGHL